MSSLEDVTQHHQPCKAQKQFQVIAAHTTFKKNHKSTLQPINKVPAYVIKICTSSYSKPCDKPTAKMEHCTALHDVQRKISHQKPKHIV
jgi:hypothetical protein